MVDYDRASHVFLVIALLGGLLYMVGGFDDITGMAVVDEMFEPAEEVYDDYVELDDDELEFEEEYDEEYDDEFEDY